jgi:hypothetical protein
MFKVILRHTFFLMLCYTMSTDQVFSQDTNRILIYANKSDFLLPFIKSTLDGMVNNKTGQRIFSTITNLNLLFVNSDADKLLRNTINFNFPDKSFRPPLNNNTRDSIFNIFIQNDRFLLINENILLDKIEFQLTLYEILPNKKKLTTKGNDFPLKNLIKPISENNFFVDIGSADYLDILKNGVKKLIPESNYLTDYKSSILGNISKIGDNKYLVPVGDTIYVRVIDVFDKDTPLDKIDFTININSDSTTNYKLYSFTKLNRRDFQIVFSTKGKYKLAISADDGVLKSSKDTISFELINVPKIIALPNTINLIYSANFLTKRNRLAFNFPVIVRGDDPGYDFKIDFPRKQKTEKEKIIDSLRNIYGEDVFIDNRTGRILTPKNSRQIHYDNPFKQKIKKISSNLYLVSIKDEAEFFDSSINVYAYTQGLKTNIENIKLKIIAEAPITIKSGIGSNTIDFKLDSNFTKVRYMEVIPWEVQCRLYAVNRISMGLSISVGFVSNSSTNTNNFLPIKKVNGITQNISITASTQESKRDLFFDYGISFIVKGNSFTFDSIGVYNDYGKINGYFSYGAKFHLNISSIKMRGLGLFLSGSFSSGNYRGLRFDSYGYSLGLQYTPFYRN